jgi:hypothetical protein
MFGPRCVQPPGEIVIVMDEFLKLIVSTLSAHMQ